jgi:hypothetical protein
MSSTGPGRVLFPLEADQLSAWKWGVVWGSIKAGEEESAWAAEERFESQSAVRRTGLGTRGCSRRMQARMRTKNILLSVAAYQPVLSIGNNVVDAPAQIVLEDLTAVI